MSQSHPCLKSCRSAISVRVMQSNYGGVRVRDGKREGKDGEREDERGEEKAADMRQGLSCEQPNMFKLRSHFPCPTC